MWLPFRGADGEHFHSASPPPLRLEQGVPCELGLLHLAGSAWHGHDVY